MDQDKIRAAALRIIGDILERPRGWKNMNARTDGLAPPSLSVFKRLDPLGFGQDDDEFWLFNPLDFDSPEVIWPMNVGSICSYDGKLDINLVRSIEMKAARGLAKKFSRYMVRCDHAQLVEDGLVTSASFHSWLGGKWVDADRGKMWDNYGNDEWRYRGDNIDIESSNPVALSMSLALKQRYEWAVSLGFEDSPSIRFATDPSGIKDAFRIRDLPEGKDRREALIRWVTDHWRQNRNDPDIEIYVRKHLRGATRFSWKGFECEILPAQFDIDQRNKFLAERQEMKKLGEDRRIA